MRGSLLTSAMMAMLATSNFPIHNHWGDPDHDHDPFNGRPPDTSEPAEAERVTRELTDLDLDRLAKAEAKRARKREKYRA